MFLCAHIRFMYRSMTQPEIPQRNRTFIDIDFNAKSFSMVEISKSSAGKPTKALAIDVIYDSDMKYLFSMYTHSLLQSNISSLASRGG